METKGGFYITQIKQLHDRIFERLLNPENIISLTEYAKSIQEQYEQVSQQMNTLFYEGFSEEEQRQFEQYLARILDTLTKNLHVKK